MLKNKDAIKIIEKYDDKLSYLKNSEGWFKYRVAVAELLKQDFLSEEEISTLKSYNED